MWLLLVIVLNATGVKQAEVYNTYNNEKECLKAQQEIMDNNPPPNVNFGCVPLRGYGQV